MFTTYAKATVGAIVAALSVAATAAVDNSIDLQEALYISGAFFAALGAIWATPNKP